MTVPAQSGPGTRGPAATETVVLDASLAVDLLAGTELAAAAAARLRGTALHVPAHFFADVLSALGRLHRDGALADDQVAAAVQQLTTMPVTEHPPPALLAGSWRRRGRLRLLDALYVELAEHLDVMVLTTDRGLARAGSGRVEAVPAS
ncbi:type II toxin-antitoxin system VapC family toxin [Actinomycetospora cinnamomea]|uniref:Ribonuclease VapC n=1 Tax=Actinomycetospora cinnamomea TaxID=663609 RepID=A0A2U1EVM8_9PSEU|nr:PIN domain-containing protein [Actinomycetospora cinnamomea]PVZ03969.1 putative nucleic acid-binding protein [Actinomycetospora cinnamomea]